MTISNKNLSVFYLFVFMAGLKEMDTMYLNLVPQTLVQESIEV